MSPEIENLKLKLQFGHKSDPQLQLLLLKKTTFCTCNCNYFSQLQFNLIEQLWFRSWSSSMHIPAYKTWTRTRPFTMRSPKRTTRSLSCYWTLMLICPCVTTMVSVRFITRLCVATPVPSGWSLTSWRSRIRRGWSMRRRRMDLVPCIWLAWITIARLLRLLSTRASVISIYRISVSRRPCTWRLTGIK